MQTEIQEKCLRLSEVTGKEKRLPLLEALNTGAPGAIRTPAP